MKGASGVTRSIIDELQSWDIQGYKTEGKSGVTRSIIDEFLSWDIQGDQKEGENGALGVSLMKFILRTLKEIT